MAGGLELDQSNVSERERERDEKKDSALVFFLLLRPGGWFNIPQHALLLRASG